MSNGIAAYRPYVTLLRREAFNQGMRRHHRATPSLSVINCGVTPPTSHFFEETRAHKFSDFCGVSLLSPKAPSERIIVSGVCARYRRLAIMARHSKMAGSVTICSAYIDERKCKWGQGAAHRNIADVADAGIYFSSPVMPINRLSGVSRPVKSAILTRK